MGFDNQSILLTGGTGSFGKKCIEVLLRDHNPSRLIILSRDELKQHEMRVNGFDDERLRYFIGDVRDLDRLRRAFHGVDVVIHAAAMKQVPACEYNPIEAIMTNVMGGRNVIEAALDAQVQKVMAISTDKAVSPENLYGATKLVAEKLFVQANAYRGTGPTRFACVRYGNVVASRGSVIPLFLEQRRSGKLTITDPRMTRFWITLDQAIDFVLRCTDQMHGGELFIPKIPSMSVLDLARSIGPDCELEEIGIRPGEKLHEVLLSEDEARHSREFDTMFIVMPASPSWHEDEGPAKGKPIPDGFRYSSDSNPQSLREEQLADMIRYVQ